MGASSEFVIFYIQCSEKKEMSQGNVSFICKFSYILGYPYIHNNNESSKGRELLNPDINTVLPRNTHKAEKCLHGKKFLELSARRIINYDLKLCLSWVNRQERDFFLESHSYIRLPLNWIMVIQRLGTFYLLSVLNKLSNMLYTNS
jgi:hypothetical protein